MHSVWKLGARQVAVGIKSGCRPKVALGCCGIKIGCIWYQNGAPEKVQFLEAMDIIGVLEPRASWRS